MMEPVILPQTGAVEYSESYNQLLVRSNSKIQVLNKMALETEIQNVTKLKKRR